MSAARLPAAISWRPGGPPPLEVGEAMIVGGSYHQMIGQLPSQSIFSTDSSPNS